MSLSDIDARREFLRSLGIDGFEPQEAVFSGKTYVEVPEERPLDQYLSTFMQREPYFAGILLRINKFYTRDVPTMAVTWHKESGEFTLLVNPDFVSKLHLMKAAEEIEGVLVHEVLHLHNRHLTSRAPDWSDPRARQIFLAASDMANNTTILHELNGKLPGSPWVPGLRPGEPADPAKFPLSQEEREKLDRTPLNAVDEAFIRSPRLKSMEFYTSELEKVWPDVLVIPGGTDDHTPWEEPGESTQAREALKDIIMQSVMECESKGTWGSVSARMREEIRRLLTVEVPWEEQLRDWVGTHVNGYERSSTWSRVCKRFRGSQPGKRRNQGIRVAFCRDESASMSNRMLELVSKELEGLSQLSSLTVIPFDTQVNEKAVKEYVPGDTVDLTRTCTGGTDFDAPTKWVNQRAERFDVLIVATDGECSQPAHSVVPRLWLVAPGKRLLFSTRDKVIQLTDSRSK